MNAQTRKLPALSDVGDALNRINGWTEQLADFVHTQRTQALLAASLVLVFLVACLAGYYALDNAGKIPHTIDTPMYLGQADWPDGTSRNCAALPQQDGSIYFLGCVEGFENYTETQSVSVTYWGKTKRPDMFQAITQPGSTTWQWRCQKKKDSLTCYAVN
jgi:hypothetical protein